jgi:uncharacterized membrane protein YfcA
LEQFTLFVISLVANMFSAFSGGGAGLLQLPALIFLGLPFGTALATHRIASVALGLGATIRHLREGSLDGQFAAGILAWGVPGVILGASFILHVPGRAAEIALGLLILGLGIYSIRRRELGLSHQPKHRNRRGRLLGGLGMFSIGVLNGSLSAGTGLFLTLWLVRWYGFDYKRAVAHTLVLVGMFWNGAGALTLGILGDVHWLWLPVLLAGSLIGGYLGAHLSIKKGNRWIKRGFEAVTILVGFKLVLG